jgi:hypothetical protein
MPQCVGTPHGHDPASCHSGFKPLINGLPSCLFNAVTLI